jgi:hypothetical protein
MDTDAERKAKRAAYAREYRKRNPGDKRKGKRAEYSAKYRQTEQYKAAQKKYRTSEKRKITDTSYQQYARDVTPEKPRAREAVRSALRKGQIVRPSRCQHCNQECKPQAHHEDYSKPLDVVWLCVSCHTQIHRAAETRNQLTLWT